MRDRDMAIGAVLLFLLFRRKRLTGNIGRLLSRLVYVTGPTMAMAVPQWIPFKFQPPQDSTGDLLLKWWRADGVGEMDMSAGDIDDWAYFWANPYPTVNEKRGPPS